MSAVVRDWITANAQIGDKIYTKRHGYWLYLGSRVSTTGDILNLASMAPEWMNTWLHEIDEPEIWRFKKGIQSGGHLEEIWIRVTKYRPEVKCRSERYEKAADLIESWTDTELSRQELREIIRAEVRDFLKEEKPPF